MSSGIDRASEREHLLDRLQNLRAILPVFAQELASARRQTARLRLENAVLTEQVRELQRKRVRTVDRTGLGSCVEAASRLGGLVTGKPELVELDSSPPPRTSACAYR